MPPVGFEPMISGSERPQTYALERAATVTGICQILPHENNTKTTRHFCSTQIFIKLIILAVVVMGVVCMKRLSAAK